MTSWNELRTELDRLIDLPPDEQRRQLTRLSERDARLAQELGALLEHDRRAQADETFLRTGPEHTARIGPYELLHELGRGGMGVVHLARRADGAFERRVALKLIQAGVGDERVLERFRRERQVLANLEHPGIARLIEGGATEDGTPFLVMEYVEGTAIDAYCDADRLTVHERIELFLEVCDAVQHAHGNLVVHRDLKPRNILVTASGRAVLLDFGIAKVLDREKSSATPDVTVGLMPFLTPAYASPEQVTGRPVTVASDVYSLGIVLYELLTGKLPYAVETTSLAELERTVCEAEPARPSATVSALDAEASEAVARARSATPRGLVRALQGDLDRVLLKALRKSTRERYATVDKLAQDLRNHLAGLPVTARPTTFVYRTAKFVRRNRAKLAAAGAVAAALIAGLVVSVSQYRRAESARLAERDERERALEQQHLAEERLAEAERLGLELAAERAVAEERVREVEGLNRALKEQRQIAERRFADVRTFATELIFDVHRALYPLPGSTRAQEIVLNLGVEFLDRLAADTEGDRGLQILLAKAYLRVASIQGNFIEANLGRLDDALELVSKAVDLATAVLAEGPGEREATMLLAQVLAVRGTLLRGAGREAEGIDDFERAVEASAPIAADANAAIEELNIACSVKASLAEVLQERGALEEALPLYEECADLLETMIAQWGHPQHAAQLELIRAAMASVDFHLGRPDEGFEQLERALTELEAIAARNPGDRNLARRTRVARSWGATMYSRDRRYERAADLIERNMAEGRHQMGVDPADYQCRQDYVFDARQLMTVRNLQDEPELVLELCDDIEETARELVQRNPADVRTTSMLAGILCERGTVRRERGLLFEAAQSLQEARELLERVLARAPDLNGARAELARVFREYARATRASTGAEDERRVLATAVDWYDRALVEAEALIAAGIAPEDVDVDALRAERADARAALEDLAD